MNMHILFLYNASGGKGLKKKQIQYIKDELGKLDPDFQFVIPESADDFKNRAKNSCGVFDYLLVSGGDGSINLAVNQLAEKDNAPVLGFFPTGTCNDAAKNYGINKNIKRNIRIIKKGHIESFDVLRCNSGYAVFAMAVGGLANIPYLTSRKGKEKIGAWAYYFDGMSKMFEKSKVKGTAVFKDGRSVDFVTPFVVALNTSHVGGYNVNPHSDVQDGKFDLFLVRKKRQIPAIFSFVFHSKRIPHYCVNEVYLKTDCQDDWDIDGERGEKGDMHITLVKNGIKVLCDKNRRKQK